MIPKNNLELAIAAIAIGLIVWALGGLLSPDAPLARLAMKADAPAQHSEASANKTKNRPSLGSVSYDSDGITPAPPPPAPAAITNSNGSEPNGSISTDGDMGGTILDRPMANPDEQNESAAAQSAAALASAAQ